MFYSSSSRSGSKTNSDGTHKIFCWKCFQPITNSPAPITRAICALCQHAEETGTALPENILDIYKFSKAGIQDVSLLHVKHEQRIQEDAGVKFTLRGMGGDILQALGLGKKKPPVEPVKSTAVAVQKQREPLFNNVLELDSVFEEAVKEQQDKF